MPFTSFDDNAAWTEMVLAAADLLVWCQQLLLHGEPAVAEPRTLRYRLLHIAGGLMPPCAAPASDGYDSPNSGPGPATSSPPTTASPPSPDPTLEPIRRHPG